MLARSIHTLIFILALSITSVGASLASAAVEPRVTLEVLIAPGSPATAPHEWMAALNRVGFASLQFRSPQRGEQVEPVVEGGGASYRVTGILTAQNRLLLPGASFSMRDIAGIEAWMERLQEGGEEGLSDREGAFGLYSRDLLTIHDALTRPVTRATHGELEEEVIHQIIDSLSVDVEIRGAARRALEGETRVLDELQGISAGTALAAALRPRGLVIFPQKERGRSMELIITDSQSATESWPVGWAPEEEARHVVPDFFEFIEIEIVDTPLLEALEAVAGRLDLPLLYDHNSMARHQIDPSEVRVSYPAGRTFYKRILDRILRQAELKAELRVDESEKPFLWITTVRP